MGNKHPTAQRAPVEKRPSLDNASSSSSSNKAGGGHIRKLSGYSASSGGGGNHKGKLSSGNPLFRSPSGTALTTSAVPVRSASTVKITPAESQVRRQIRAQLAQFLPRTVAMDSKTNRKTTRGGVQRNSDLEAVEEEEDSHEQEQAVHRELTDLLAMYYIHHDFLRYIGRTLDLDKLATWTLDRGLEHLDVLLERKYNESLTSFMHRLNLNEQRVDVASGMWRMSDQYLMAGNLSKTLLSKKKMAAAIDAVQKDLSASKEHHPESIGVPSLARYNSLHKSQMLTTINLDRLAMRRKLVRAGQSKANGEGSADDKKHLLMGKLDLDHVGDASNRWVVDSLRIELESFFCENDPRGIREEVFRMIMAFGINVGRRELERILYFAYRQHLNNACGPLILNHDEVQLHKEKLEALLICFYNHVDTKRVQNGSVDVEAVAEWALDSGMARLNSKLMRQYQVDLVSFLQLSGMHQLINRLSKIADGDVQVLLDATHELDLESEPTLGRHEPQDKFENSPGFELLGRRDSRIPASIMTHQAPGQTHVRPSNSLSFWASVRSNALAALAKPESPFQATGAKKQDSGNLQSTALHLVYKATRSTTGEENNSQKDAAPTSTPSSSTATNPTSSNNSSNTVARIEERMNSKHTPFWRRRKDKSTLSTAFPSLSQSRSKFTTRFLKESVKPSREGAKGVSKLESQQLRPFRPRNVNAINRPKVGNGSSSAPLSSGTSFATDSSRVIVDKKSMYGKKPRRSTIDGTGGEIEMYREKLKQAVEVNQPKLPYTTKVGKFPNPITARSTELRDQLEAFLLREDPSKLVDRNSDLGITSLVKFGTEQGRDALNRKLSKNFNGANLNTDKEQQQKPVGKLASHTQHASGSPSRQTSKPVLASQTSVSDIAKKFQSASEPSTPVGSRRGVQEKKHSVLSLSRKFGKGKKGKPLRS